MSILETKNLGYSYNGKSKVLEDISISFDVGKMYAILGPSGCGKTTLLSLLGGLDVPTKGEVVCNGENINKLGLAKHRHENVSFIFQAYNLIDYMNSIENVKLTSKKAPLPILERLGLTKEETKRNVLKLSGGQQQRVAIARALASDTAILLADEPTGNLDEDTAEEITQILKESAHELKRCVIIVTHSVSDTKHTVVNLPQSIDILSLYHKEVFQMSTKFTDDEWLLIFQQRTQSGLSVRKWCDSNQISYDKYKYWEKKLLRRSDPERAVSPMDFVELPQALLPPLSLEQEQSYPFELSFHGLHLKIASHAQLSQLAGILKILQASC